MLTLPMFYELAAVFVTVCLYAAWHVLRPIRSRPRHPSVAHRKKRGNKNVLRQRYKKAEVPDRPDAIVIGSGPGGLTTAALLAKQGKCVVVLEQHERAGGGMHSFDSHGFEWDTGFHYIGEMQQDSPLTGIVKYLIGDSVEWAWLADNKHSRGAYDTAMFGKERYDILAGRQNFRDVLVAAFPEEASAIDAIMEEVKRMECFTFYLIWKTLPKFLRWLLPCLRKPFQDLTTDTTMDVLRRHTDNEKLIGLFTYIWGCYSSTPVESSWAIHAMITAHYSNGACFPVGGPEEIVRGFVDTIEAAGGRVLVNARVEKVLLNDAGDRAIGVRMSKDGEEILCPYVVSSIGVHNTFSKLVPPAAAARAGWQKLEKEAPVKPGRGHVTLFCGFDVDGDEAGLPAANTWIFPECYDHEKNTREFLADPEAFLDGGDTFPYICMAFPSEKDPSFRERRPGKSTACLLVEVDPEMFMSNKFAANAKTHKRGDDHDALKERFADRLFQILFKHYPHLEDHLVHYEVGTPLCANYYLGKIYGDSYGLEYTPSFFDARDTKLDPQTKITGLYLSGQDVSCNGFGGAMMGGIYCAARIISPWRMWYELVGSIGVGNLTKPPEDVSPKYRHNLLTAVTRPSLKRPQETVIDECEEKSVPETAVR